MFQPHHTKTLEDFFQRADTQEQRHYELFSLLETQLQRIAEIEIAWAYTYVNLTIDQKKIFRKKFPNLFKRKTYPPIPDLFNEEAAAKCKSEYTSAATTNEEFRKECSEKREYESYQQELQPPTPTTLHTTTTTTGEASLYLSSLIKDVYSSTKDQFEFSQISEDDFHFSQVVSFHLRFPEVSLDAQLMLESWLKKWKHFGYSVDVLIAFASIYKEKREVNPASPV